MKNDRHNKFGFGIDPPVGEGLVTALVALGVPERQARRCDDTLREAVILPFAPRLRLVRATASVPTQCARYRRPPRS
jgi:hypothetical protein